jgi:secondary thiamine-phosphate synthase enzyme
VKTFERTLRVATRRGLTMITSEVERAVAAAEVRSGLCTVFIRHTSASLLIQENADPSVRDDLEAFLGRLVKEGDPLFTHTTEGPDDMPAHVKSALTRTSESIPIVDGRLALGTWQGLYVWEHRAGRHQREVLVQVLGNPDHR